jgi:hypothetical protein
MGKLANNKACSSYFGNKNGSYRDMVPIWKTKMAALGLNVCCPTFQTERGKSLSQLLPENNKKDMVIRENFKKYE